MADEQAIASHSDQEYGKELKFAIENAVFTLVGPIVLGSLHKHLMEKHGITADEVPSHLDTLSATFEKTFGPKGAGTLERAIAKRFYFRCDLRFTEKEGYRLHDYIQDAIKQLDHQNR